MVLDGTTKMRKFLDIAGRDALPQGQLVGGLEVAPGVGWGWGQRGSRENLKETRGLSEVSVDNMKEIFFPRDSVGTVKNLLQTRK